MCVLITIYYAPDSSGKSIVKCCKTKILSFPFLFCSQGLNFQLAAVLFSLGFYSYVEYGEKTFNTLSVDGIVCCLGVTIDKIYIQRKTQELPPKSNNNRIKNNTKNNNPNPPKKNPEEKQPKKTNTKPYPTPKAPNSVY